MTAMVRRVLDAIHAAGIESAKRHYYWSDVLIEDGDAIARAAIAAMREPTPEMQRQWDEQEEHTGFQSNCPMCGGHLKGWQIMIDAALKK